MEDKTEKKMVPKVSKASFSLEKPRVNSWWPYAASAFPIGDQSNTLAPSKEEGILW